MSQSLPADSANPEGIPDDDPLSGFDSEVGARPSESGSPAPVTVGPIEVSTARSDSADELPAKLEQTTLDPQESLEQTALDRRKSVAEVAALRSELATIVGRVRHIENQLARKIDPTPLRMRPATRSYAPIAALIAASIILILVNGWLWRMASDRRSADVATAAAAVMPSPLAAAEPARAATAPSSTPAGATSASAQVARAAARQPPREFIGTLTVQTVPPGAAVFVNRKVAGTTPLRLNALRAGAHLIWIERDGYKRWTRVVTVPADQVTQVSAELQPDAGAVSLRSQ